VRLRGLRLEGIGYLRTEDKRFCHAHRCFQQTVTLDILQRGLVEKDKLYLWLIQSGGRKNSGCHRNGRVKTMK
jgi:hypothetical protein